jgi:hypothetical protein
MQFATFITQSIKTLKKIFHVCVYSTQLLLWDVQVSLFLFKTSIHKEDTNWIRTPFFLQLQGRGSLASYITLKIWIQSNPFNNHQSILLMKTLSLFSTRHFSLQRSEEFSLVILSFALTQLQLSHSHSHSHSLWWCMWSDVIDELYATQRVKGIILLNGSPPPRSNSFRSLFSRLSHNALLNHIILFFEMLDFHRIQNIPIKEWDLLHGIQK